MITEAAVYLDGLTQVEMTEYGPNWRQPGAFAWVSVQEPDAGDLARLHAAVGVAPQALSAAYEDLQRPGMQVVEDAVIEDGRAELRGGPLALLRGVLDLVIDSYLLLIDDIDREIRSVEREVFPLRGTNPVERIYRLRRLLTDLEQATGPLVDEPLERLVRRRLPTWVSADPYAAEIGEQALHEIDRHFRQIDGRVRSRRELLDGVLNANLTQVGIRQNDWL
ncbi:hypothetical protein OG203_14740 [Nocardia sp. NBC_01499]|uniref:CorA family divalent cation transporter n=1 Tax=Nocardia sp. NBC_01499 TaxID=2903597 RepID=UPI00386315FD